LKLQDNANGQTIEDNILKLDATYPKLAKKASDGIY